MRKILLPIVAAMFVFGSCGGGEPKAQETQPAVKEAARTVQSEAQSATGESVQPVASGCSASACDGGGGGRAHSDNCHCHGHCSNKAGCKCHGGH